MTAAQPSHRSCADILTDYQNQTLSAEAAIAQLTTHAQSNPDHAAAFGIDATDRDACQQWVTHLFDRYRDYWPAFCQLCQETLKITPYPAEMLWQLWLPLAMQLADLRQSLERPVVQGVLGGQGTGKTTLATVLTHLLGHLGYRVCGFSIDDMYKTHRDRQRLMDADPRLRWRGPPGTHDIDLGLQVLRQVKQGDAHTPIAIPRFDKSLHNGSGDRIEPETVQGIDVLLFEGWFVGARPVDPAAFDTAPPPIVTEGDRKFACDMNTRLADYLPLWDELDRLMVLYPTDYRLSQQWRQQAEDKMKATGKSGMSDDEIRDFVEYFWRSLHPDLFIAPLLHPPDSGADDVNLVVTITPDRSIQSIYTARG